MSKIKRVKLIFFLYKFNYEQNYIKMAKMKLINK